MKETQNCLPSGENAPRISLDPPANSRFRFFAVFLVCCALLVAVFAASAVLIKSGILGEKDFLLFGKEGADSTSDEIASSEEERRDPAADFPIPDGAIPIVSKDLSYSALGSGYLHNETLYAPSVSELLKRDLLPVQSGDAPQILILHTHTSESYLEEGTTFLEGAPGDLTYSKEEDQNLLAVGRALAEALNEKGITAIHCTVMHDEPTLSGAYERSAETVRQYLKEYPTITYVIDLHRDALMTSDGEYVKTASSDPSIAQIMAVVGSDCNGTSHPNWEENLALSLQLREALNQKVPNACRPVSLRNASYNQELAPRFLLLEIGSGGNSVEEAKNAARLVGEVLAELLYAR